MPIVCSRYEAEHWSLYSWSQLHAILCMQLWSISEIVHPTSGTTRKPNCEHTCKASKLLTQVSVVLWKHTFVWCAAFTQYPVDENVSPRMDCTLSLSQLPV